LLPTLHLRDQLDPLTRPFPNPSLIPVPARILVTAQRRDNGVRQSL
jgi:hypothetical protein